MTSKLPTWYPPTPYTDLNDLQNKAHPIYVTNSLTRAKVNYKNKKQVQFVPKNGRTVYWYSCGPTVYDVSHLGHARTYLTFDIIQRIMRDYFNYDIVSIMNITDIDDKIIDRSIANRIAARDLARENEIDFFKDMDDLGIKRPDILTRVTEYLEEVIEMVEKIISNGYGYETNKSVYFNVKKYSSSNAYAKLVPENIGSEKESESKGLSDKQDDCDFALWKGCHKEFEMECPEKDHTHICTECNKEFNCKENKNSKGEHIHKLRSEYSKQHNCETSGYCYKSPWGYGRPGWHIECSAMSVDALKPFTGGSMDIHSGGIDLRFPHHDNEMAQSEAYLNEKQSINYFLHSGHLEIDGLKMSKSLKNFLTIKNILTQNTARQIRLFFLYNKWNASLAYVNRDEEQKVVGTLEEYKKKDAKFANFFNNINYYLRLDHKNENTHFDEEGKKLLTLFNDSKLKIYNSFCDDFNTEEAMKTIEDLIGGVYKYMERPNIVYTIIQSIGLYITKIFRVLGLITDNDIGYQIENKGSMEILSPILDALTTFRDNVKKENKEVKSNALFKLCDELRDDILPNLGVKLEDTVEGTKWILCNAEELKKEKEEQYIFTTNN